jgi:hypothetical protein
MPLLSPQRPLHPPLSSPTVLSLPSSTDSLHRPCRRPQVWRPRFSAGVFNPNEKVNCVDFGQTTVNLGHHLETSPTTPNDPFWSTLVNPWSNPTQNPLNTPCPPVSAGTFATFSKFHLNTSKSPNVKVVCFVERNNFHVEWHLRFEA